MKHFQGVHSIRQSHRWIVSISIGSSNTDWNSVSNYSTPLKTSCLEDKPGQLPKECKIGESPQRSHGNVIFVDRDNSESPNPAVVNLAQDKHHFPRGHSPAERAG